MLAASRPPGVAAFDLGCATPDADGFGTGSFVPDVGGTRMLSAFNDTEIDDGLICPGELTCNPSVLTFAGIGGLEPVD